MLRKPWPIIFISIIFFLVPLLNIYVAYYPLRYDLSLLMFLENLLDNSDNYFNLFTMIAPGFVAGYAIFSVRKWSYSVFIVCLIWITIQVISDFSPHMDASQFIITIMLPIAFNFLCVSYILLPEVRATYFDPRLRWWETKPRYLFTTDITLTIAQTIYKGKTTNVSEGGLFIMLSEPVEPHLILDAKFEILKTDFMINAKVVYRAENGLAHGLQFVDLKASQQRELANIMSILAKADYEESRPATVWTEDLLLWIKTLFKTGQGIVPNVPKKR